jgi:hypothetical protein
MVPDLVAGGVAGLVATVPMTAFMEAAHDRLPRDEQYSLPPRQITEEIAEKAGVDDHLDERQRTGLTIASHFAYGAAAGAAFAPLIRNTALPRVTTGIAYGLAVWAGSYLGWLPAAHIHRPATEEPAGRNALMIGAHVVYGAALGLLVDVLSPRRY